MKILNKETALDKATDLLVVIFGILIALSIDSYKETKQERRQWEIFAKNFKSEALELKASYTEIALFYKERYSTTTELIKELGTKNIKNVKTLDKFLPTMGQIKADFRKDTLFDSLVKSGNEFLLDDIELLHSLGNMYGFESLALSNVNTISNHFMPEYMKFIKKYYSSTTNKNNLKDDLVFLLHNYANFMKHNQKNYENQIKVVSKVLKNLEK